MIGISQRQFQRGSKSIRFTECRHASDGNHKGVCQETRVRRKGLPIIVHEGEQMNTKTPSPDTDVEETHQAEKKAIYWHRDLPPLDAEPIGEDTVEANSEHVPGTLAHRDELWQRCYSDLMQRVNARVIQEIARTGGHYAHVLKEAVDSKHNDVSGEAWLHGMFTYVVYRKAAKR